MGEFLNQQKSAPAEEMNTSTPRLITTSKAIIPAELVATKVIKE